MWQLFSCVISLQVALNKIGPGCGNHVKGLDLKMVIMAESTEERTHGFQNTGIHPFNFVVVDLEEIFSN